jgi:hypothetical protein
VEHPWLVENDPPIASGPIVESKWIQFVEDQQHGFHHRYFPIRPHKNLTWISGRNTTLASIFSMGSEHTVVHVEMWFFQAMKKDVAEKLSRCCQEVSTAAGAGDGRFRHGRLGQSFPISMGGDVIPVHCGLSSSKHSEVVIYLYFRYGISGFQCGL